MGTFQKEAETLFEYTRQLRRDFHQHPELGMNVFRSAEIVAKELRELGYEVKTGVGQTGVVGQLRTGKPGKTILLRFDMDALPIQEDTGVEYASCNPGVMHACGHDAHMAVGLTVCRMIMKHRDRLSGNIVFMFQPGEEGAGGAEKMIADGVLDNPKPDYALSFHVWNEKPVGWLALKSGPLMAGSGIFKITVTGRGGHGATPHFAIDPVLAGAQIITSLQSIVSRNISPLESAVVSVTMMKAGDAFNIIPQTAVIQGTTRAFSADMMKKINFRIESIAKNIASAMDCTAEVYTEIMTPALINDTFVSTKVEEAALYEFPDSVVADAYRTMGAEDMAFVLDRIPGCYVMAGSSNPEKGLTFGHHHPKFNFDENVLPRAAAILCAAVLNLQ